MADNSTETPSEGHDKVRKKIDIYQFNKTKWIF